MSKKQTKKPALSDEEILKQIKELSLKANNIAGSQKGLFDGVDLGDEDLDTTFDLKILDDTADPDLSHRLYYTMQSTMIRNLPKGIENAPLRRFIYEEKSLFLNRGKGKNENGVRGSDERMAYTGNFLQVAFNIVNNWVMQGANPIDLYNAFNDLNKERGYKD